jgi:hypothetical protein
MRDVRYELTTVVYNVSRQKVDTHAMVPRENGRHERVTVGKKKNREK